MSICLSWYLRAGIPQMSRSTDSKPLPLEPAVPCPLQAAPNQQKIAPLSPSLIPTDCCFTEQGLHNVRCSNLMVIGWCKSITLVILPALFTRVSSSVHNRDAKHGSPMRNPVNCPKGESEKAGNHKPLRRVVDFVAARKVLPPSCGICRPSADIQFLRRGNWHFSAKFFLLRIEFPL